MFIVSSIISRKKPLNVQFLVFSPFRISAGTRKHSEGREYSVFRDTKGRTQCRKNGKEARLQNGYCIINIQTLVPFFVRGVGTRKEGSKTKINGSVLWWFVGLITENWTEGADSCHAQQISHKFPTEMTRVPEKLMNT